MNDSVVEPSYSLWNLISAGEDIELWDKEKWQSEYAVTDIEIGSMLHSRWQEKKWKVTNVIPNHTSPKHPTIMVRELLTVLNDVACTCGAHNGDRHTEACARMVKTWS